MKHAAIDIGTNSVRLLIAEVKDKKIVSSYKTLETTRIGENVDKAGKLKDEAIERTIVALKNFKIITEENEGTLVAVIATSAVRDAANRDFFINKVKAELDLDIEVISGQKEAELGFTGVLKGLEECDGDIFVIDIGGGSTELIIGNNNGIKFMTSLNIGAVRLTEKFFTSDLVTEAELVELFGYIDSILLEQVDNINEFHIKKAIGIGGTATTLASVAQGMVVYDPNKIHNYFLSTKMIKGGLNLFKSKNLENRRRIPGLQPKRADVILAGTCILTRILELLELDGLYISEYDNLEGTIFEGIKED